LKEPLLHQKIKKFQEKIESEICANIPNAFWHRKNHVVQLPYESNFNEKKYTHKSQTYSNESRIIIILQKGDTRSNTKWTNKEE
jgi:hypothetical protein